jgi:hypothetical protein
MYSYKPKTLIVGMIKYPLSKALFVKGGSITKPSCFIEVSKATVWKHVMNIEFNALISNATWNFVPHCHNLIFNPFTLIIIIILFTEKDKKNDDEKIILMKHK